MRAPVPSEPDVLERRLHPRLQRCGRANLVRQCVRGPAEQQPQLRILRHGLSVRRAMRRGGVPLRAGLHAMRVRVFQRSGLLRRLDIEQRELRGLRQSMSRERSLLQRRDMRGSMCSPGLRAVRRHVREPANGHDALRPMLRDVRRQPPLQKWAVRMPSRNGRVLGHLLGSTQRPRQLRHMRDRVHRRPWLREGRLPIDRPWPPSTSIPRN